MRHVKKTRLYLAAIVTAMFFNSLAFADISANITQFCDSMNGLNENKGISFVYTNIGDYAGESEVQFNLQYLYSIYFVDALNGFGSETSGSGYFTSLCIESKGNALQGNTVRNGLLNYDSGSDTTRTSSGNTVSLGAAYLFKLYATGEISAVNADFYGENRSENVRELNNAIQSLMGTGIARSGNIYLDFLAGLSNGGYAGTDWTADYHLAADIDFMNGYAVFATNAGTGTDTLDYFYIAKLETGISGIRTRSVGIPDIPDTPEPATVLLWVLAGGGLAGSTWIRKRRNKQTSA